MFGLGKRRTKFGKYLDRSHMTQQDLVKASGVSNFIISKICNDRHYKPKFSTISKINKGLKRLGESTDVDDFFH